MKQLLLFLALLPLSAFCQVFPPVSTPSGWRWEVKAGIGAAGTNYETGFYPAPFIGLGSGYYFSKSRLGLHAGIGYEQHHSSEEFGLSRTKQLPYLVFPVFLRTGPSTSRLHFLLGAFYARSPVTPAITPTTYAWHFNPQEWGGLTGLEVRLHRTPRLELTLAASARFGFSPMFQADNPRYFNEAARSRLFAFTASTYFFSSK